MNSEALVNVKKIAETRLKERLAHVAKVYRKANQNVPPEARSNIRIEVMLETLLEAFECVAKKEVPAPKKTRTSKKAKTSINVTPVKASGTITETWRPPEQS